MRGAIPSLLNMPFLPHRSAVTVTLSGAQILVIFPPVDTCSYTKSVHAIHTCKLNAKKFAVVTDDGSHELVVVTIGTGDGSSKRQLTVC